MSVKAVMRAPLSMIWPDREGLGKFLGDLELFLMNIVWEWPGEYPLTVKAVHEAARAQRPLAYTTVLSTMTNLVKKGALRVEKAHFAHRYWPACSRAEFEHQVFSRLMGRLIKDASSPVLQHLVGTLEAEDPRLLEALYQEIQRRRKKGR